MDERGGYADDYRTHPEEPRHWNTFTILGTGLLVIGVISLIFHQ